MLNAKKGTTLFTGFLLAAITPIVLGFIDDPILYLDTTDNPGHPNSWTNQGTTGGQLAHHGGGPQLDANAGPNGKPTYTARKADQSYGERGISLFFEDWTIEIWIKRNGPAFGGNGEHQIFGLADKPWPFKQAILLRFDGNDDTGRIRTTLITEKAGTDHISPTRLDIGAKRWHHIALTFDNHTHSLQSYLDGKFISRNATNKSFDDEIEVKRITVFRSDIEDPESRTLNGSISLIRMYDKKLDNTEIRENYRSPHAPQAAQPTGKLTITWCRLKALF